MLPLCSQERAECRNVHERHPPPPPRYSPPQRRPHPSLKALGIRRRRVNRQGRKSPRQFLHPRRTRHLHRRRQGLPRTLRQGHARHRLAQLRPQRRPLRRPRQRSQPKARRPRVPRPGPTRLAEKRRRIPHLQHTHRRLRPRPPLGRLPQMGLGYRRLRPGVGSFKTFWLRHRSQRPHSPGPAKSRRQHHLPHSKIHRLPPARTRQSRIPRPIEKCCRRKTAQHARPHQRQLCRKQQHAGHRRHVPRMRHMSSGMSRFTFPAQTRSPLPCRACVRCGRRNRRG